ncbi:helix-turn-helix transcriptional regulator [Mycobacterium vicinigordonae]|uniref:Helix-turn-helix domain-containing protein n=1 Tax=Mycobacterium vicinigordonae TaxID=1719132 RepID=A0A7D6E011_9MYCO|nr:helix-turn-helix domain-containing protein [Mycobacterium vicinigordonae]QLL08847.1 helix-turn-helix domain-containing protein [Mycobacterium vicinigordonae]
MPDAPYVVDPPAAGRRLGVNVDTLKRWRRLGIGPTYIRIAHNRVRYRVADLDAWLDARAVIPESPAAQSV